MIMPYCGYCFITAFKMLVEQQEAPIMISQQVHLMYSYAPALLGTILLWIIMITRAMPPLLTILEQHL